MNILNPVTNQAVAEEPLPSGTEIYLNLLFLIVAILSEVTKLTGLIYHRHTKCAAWIQSCEKLQVNTNRREQILVSTCLFCFLLLKKERGDIENGFFLYHFCSFSF